MSNQLTAERLYEAVKNGRIPHAILLTGPEGGAYPALARKAAAAHLGLFGEDALDTCPDYYVLGPKAVPIEAVRALQGELGARSVSGRRAVVFLDAHNMSEATQNALLKTLEEPPRGALMLLTGLEAGLLPTIRSRCLAVRLGAEPEDVLVLALTQSGVPEKSARLAARLSGGAGVLAEDLCSEAHIAFVPRAVKLFYEAVTAALPPYAAVAELLNTAVAPPPQGEKEKRTPTEEKRLTARYCLRIMEALAEDMLRVKLELPAATFTEEAQKLRQTARRFTFQQIQDMIDLVLSAQVRSLMAHPSLTMDALVTGLGGVSQQQGVHN
ncbi:MAG TPA: hypothetical protein VN366_01845 [Feifaniaceae bacterium]|nr:hypothetical protein [Feifaniaceae bacterium]